MAKPNVTDLLAAAERVHIDLVYDVFAVLERHGFRRPEGRREQAAASADAAAAIVRLVEAYTGREQS